MIGTQVSHYTILEKLGEGGMGVVYRALDTRLDRTVALKFLPPVFQTGEQTSQRFLQEARAAAALSHPNVCSIHAVGEHEGQSFIDMEFVEGQTLRAKIAGSPLSVESAAGLAIQIGEALQEAHAKGIVHRDVKSDNIMITPKNQVKVMDFGLAKLKGSLKLTRTSSTVGTLAYMAPEQISGGEVDARSDIFSFGVVFFEMLTGRTPFRGEHEAALVYSIVHEEPEPILRLKPELPPEVVHVVQRALEKDPAERYQSVADMVIDLRRVLKQTSKVSVSRVVPVSPPPPPAAAPPAQQTPQARRSRTWLPAAGVIVALAAIAVVYLLTTSGSGRRTPSFSFESMKISRLTSSGTARAAAISPDGKYVVFSQEEAGRQSLWVRQVATGSTVQIVPPEEAFYTGLTLSNDGNFVYYVVQMAAASSPALFRIPVLGGVPMRILDNLGSAVTLSPDGTRLAFTRSYSTTGEFSVLVTNADGSGEKVLASHKGDRWYSGQPSWSPDGTTIACALGGWDGGMHFRIMSVNTETGAEKPLGDTRWKSVSGVHWSADGSSVLVQGVMSAGFKDQLWQMQVDGGAVSRLTNDLLSYRSVSLTSDGRSLCVVQDDATENIWILRTDDPRTARQLTRGKESGSGGVDWVTEDRILFGSTEGGNWDIWLTDLSGSGRRQLTNDPDMDFEPAASPDGTFFLYTSMKSGIPNIWRRKIDGSDPKQLTDGGEDYRADISPDGAWYLFDSWDAGPVLIMRAPTDGGTPVRVSPTPGSSPVLSPDGTRFAYTTFDDEERKTVVHIVPVGGDAAAQSFDLPPLASRGIRWTRDGTGVSYVATRNGVSNVWVRPLAGGTPRQVTAFTGDFISAHDWSPLGTQLAVVRFASSADVLLMTTESR